MGGEGTLLEAHLEEHGTHTPAEGEITITMICDGLPYL